VSADNPAGYVLASLAAMNAVIALGYDGKIAARMWFAVPALTVANTDTRRHCPELFLCLPATLPARDRRLPHGFLPRDDVARRLAQPPILSEGAHHEFIYLRA
jgi:hypothetical protein